MVKASPNKNNFNGGEVSKLVQQRTDMERYPSFMRYMRNCIATPQGPALGRSGTRFQHRARSNSKYSHIVPFVFSDEQANMLEFSDFTMRVLADAGTLTTGFKDITAIVSLSPFTFTSAVLAPLVAAGQQVAFTGFEDAASLEGVQSNITLVVGDDITTDLVLTNAVGSLATAQAAQVYQIVTPYSHNDVRNIVELQSIDAMYLFCKGYNIRKLERYGETDWRMSVFDMLDGPYLPEVDNGVYLTANTTANAVEIHAANIGVNGTASGGASAWNAFDDSLDSVWDSGANQSGTLIYVFNTAKVISGYTLYASRDNSNATYSAQAARPSTWLVEASVDGVTNWVTVDAQYGYALWKNYRTMHILLRNTTAYKGYRITITSLEELGPHTAKIARWVLKESGVQTVRLTASSISAVNRGKGFLSTDVGRLMRVMQSDAYWRWMRITAVVSTTVVDVDMKSEPLINLDRITRWRMGVFSDTTGWPVVGTFYDDRLCVGGAFDSPTSVGISAPQTYDLFSPTDTDNVITAANGMLIKPNTRNASPLRWLVGTDKGLILGFGSSEWVVTASTPNQTFSAVNIKATRTTSRGSAPVQPVSIDSQLLFVQANGKTLREYAYSFETDNFKSPSMTLFASHMGTPVFKQIVFAAEPHSIAWARRGDGTVVGLTYNREESVVGWHTHEFDAEIESIAVLPGPEAQDDLWAVTKRVVNSQDVRSIEKLMPFWGFDSTLATSYNVDCARRVTNIVESTTVYNARHFEGARVYGIADTKTFGYEESIYVVDGKFDLPFPAINVAYGLPYEVYGETVNFEAGAGEGTAQGKSKRVNNVTLAVWDTYGGEVGLTNEDTGEIEFTMMAGLYEQDADLIDVELFTGLIGPFNPPQGYGKKAAIIFRQTMPFPMNITAMYPQLATEDRG
jgi:hypothetical protein